MEPYLGEQFANPSALYAAARQTRQALADARRTVASVLECQADEVVFTAGATESINLAIQGVARQFPQANVLASAIEHAAVRGCVAALGERGNFVPVDSSGRVNLERLEELITDNTVLISISPANSEVGTVQPWKQIKQLIKAKKAQRKRGLPLYLHADATAASGLLDIKAQTLQADLISLNSAKIYGPAQVGCLYVRRGTQLAPLLHGGGQEKGLRPGTEDVAGAVGFATALNMVEHDRRQEAQRLLWLQQKIIQGLSDNLTGWQLNGAASDRLPGNINLTITGVEGEELGLTLDNHGVQVSTGAACSANSGQPSAVLVALGLAPEQANSSLRISLGRATTEADADALLEILPAAVEQLRARYVE